MALDISQAARSFNFTRVHALPLGASHGAALHFDQAARTYAAARPDDPDALTEDVLAEIAQAIDRHGGAFDMDYETHLYLARRLDGG
jgi:hypothetical protein